MIPWEKKMKRVLFVACIVILAATLLSCSGEITEITAKSSDVKVALGSSVDLTDYFSVVGEGNLDFAVSPTGILVPSGKSWVAAQVGECTVTAYAGDLSASVDVRVVDVNKIVVSLSDETFVYDGQVKNLTLDTTLPQGTVVEYRCDGALFTGTTEPGVYTVTVEVSAPRGYTVEYLRQTAVLTVKKKIFSVDDIRFRSQVFTYDGTEKSLVVEGDLPEGTTVRLVDATATDAGVYNAKAYFIVDERYYEEPPVLSARLTIVKKNLVEGSLDRTDVCTYDAQDHFPTLDLPAGLTAEYFVLQGDEYVSKSAFYASFSGRAFVDSGEYVVRANLTVDPALRDNYAAPETANIIVRIAKADFSSDLRWKTASAVYNGEAYTLGYGDDYDFGLTGELPKGVGGEFPDGVTVRFFSNGTLAATHSYTDAGKYSVAARFSLPDGYARNYNALPDLNYTVIIEKATYPIGFSFDQKDENEVDFSDGHTYDGLPHRFSLTFASEEEKDAFVDDCNLTYYTVKDYSTRTTFSDAASILDVGTYTVGYEISFKKADLIKNYIVPQSGSFETKIVKIVFDMTEVLFLSDSVVYDGDSHTIQPTGVPAGVTANVSGGDKTNAGRYLLTVTFAPTDWPASACVLRGRDGAVSYYEAYLTIEKARYTESDLPADCAAQGGIYSPTATLADRAITVGGEPTSVVRWKTPTEKPTCDRTLYQAIYNADEQNYYGYTFMLTSETTQVTLDAALFSASEQFLPYDGKEASPVYTYDGADPDPTAYRLSYVKGDGDDAKSIGTHVLHDLTVVLVDEVNYDLTGENDLGDLTVHIYDRNLFEYEGLVLKKYKGAQVDIIVPEGTTNIYNKAFDGCAALSLTLPSSVVSVSTSALSGMNSLRRLTIPYVGTTPGGVLSAPFGTAGLPETLTEVIVTEETTVAANAFKNASNLLSVVYQKPVTAVGGSAFEGCEKLTSASFPGLVSLGEAAFKRCVGMTTLTIPFFGATGFSDTATYLFGDNVGDNAFTNYRIETIDLRSGAFSLIPQNAFKGLSSLQEVYLPESATSYESNAFSGISAAVHLPTSLTALSDGAFWGYEGTAVTLPDNLVVIGNDVFRGASSILIINIPKKVTQIGERAFFNVSAEIRFAADAFYTRVGTRTFAGYAGAGVTLPTGVQDLDDYAFEGSALTAVTTAATLGKYVFSGCESLLSATIYSEVLPEGTFRGCVNLASLALPNVAIVGKRACENCSSLETLELPSVLTDIEEYAFDGCTALELMTVLATAAPTLGTHAFPSDSKIWSLYVPAGSRTAYEALIAEKGYANVVVREIGQ